MIFILVLNRSLIFITTYLSYLNLVILPSTRFERGHFMKLFNNKEKTFTNYKSCNVPEIQPLN